MIDLSDISSLPVRYDPQLDTFVFDENIKCNSCTKIVLDRLVPALLNKTLKYPETVYSESENIYLNDDAGIFAANPVKYELVVLPPGLLGIEFIKSHVYYHDEEKSKKSCVVECIHGILTVIIQKNQAKDEFDFETSIEEGILITLRPGEKVSIPSGHFYTFINSRSKPAIFSRIFRSKGVVDYSLIQREKGLGYFAIRKNARTEIVYNPKYREVPKLKKCTSNCEDFKVEYSKECLYDSVKKNPNYFIEILLSGE